ncbi:hypothetical protein QVD17_07754 [Tagetes erecta]|uniref:Uncharacterized protein n=1 Tax=Tagetes erecta TaxID=13708 RepID=A0AAD8P2S2_TARER|nr:hypothetical protein QVD17_07754 [Tagetes erecta]
MGHEIKKALARLEEIPKWVFEPIKAAVVGVAKGIACSSFVDLFFLDAKPIQYPLPLYEHKLFSRFGGYQPLALAFMGKSQWEQARFCGVTCGAVSGISCLMKNLRGKHDVQSCMVTALGGAVTLSLVAGLRGRDVISFSVVTTLVSCVLFKVGENPSNRKEVPTRVMFSRDHFFTDNALSLHTDHRQE